MPSHPTVTPSSPLLHNVQTHSTSMQPSSKKQKLAPPAISSDLGKYIINDVQLLQQLGWTNFVITKRQRGDLASMSFQHPAQHLLTYIKKRGVPVRLTTSPWSPHQLQQAIDRGPHRSCYQFLDFLEQEFIDMIDKNQWVILPFHIAKNIPNLHLSPPGVVPQRNRRPRWIGDYTWSGINDNTLPLSPNEAMQFGHALDRFLRELLLCDPKHGPPKMLKLDISDGFYRLDVAPADCPKLGVVFPSRRGQPPLVAIPLVLPMGWKNSPPFFSAATETAADLANAAIQSQSTPAPHPLEPHAAAYDSRDNITANTDKTVFPAPAIESSAPTSLPPTNSNTSHASTPVNTPPNRDPCLPSNPSPHAYIDVFVDDFIALCQGPPSNQTRVRQCLMHAVDSVFRPNDFYDGPHRREPISIKKLKQGDTSWNTSKQVLGWIINSITMTIHLPPHRKERLAQILASVPLCQKRLSVKKWHKILGELRSMSIALPGSRHLFSTMQHALATKSKARIALNKGVHNALNDFRWMHADIASRPTRIAELIPLNPCALGFHDASGRGAGGVWYSNPELLPRQPTLQSQPMVWRLSWPRDIIANLITDSNPHGTINNSDLELAGALLHLDVLAQHFDIRERTILSKTDNLATLFWQRKGSTTTTKAPAHLLRLLGIHQRFHRYVPRFDFMPGKSNPMADDASRLLHFSNSTFLTHFNSTYPQPQSYKLVTPTLPMISSVISALRMKMCKLESLLVEPPPLAHTGPSGKSTPISWASTPFSTPSKIKFQSSKFSSSEFDLASLQPSSVRSSLGQLKTTYGLLPRRTWPWGPQIHA